MSSLKKDLKLGSDQFLFLLSRVWDTLPERFQFSLLMAR